MGDVKIPEGLLRDLVMYHWGDRRDPALEARIRDGLARKVEALARRKEYQKGAPHAPKEEPPINQDTPP